MPFYRNIFKQALKLTWRNKFLWWFGAFALFLGNGGEFEILSNTLSSDPSDGPFPFLQTIASTGLFSPKTLTNLGSLLMNDTVNLLFFLMINLLLLAVLLFIIWIIVVSQAAIVNNSAALLNSKKSLTFRDGLNSGVANFWPVLLVNIIVKAFVGVVIFTAVILPIIFYKPSPGVFLFYILIFVISIILAITISFIGKYTIAYVIINKTKLLPALNQGWQLFRENWLVSFEMAIMLFAINLLVGLAILVAVSALAVPFLFLGFLFYYSFSVAASWIIAILALFCLLLFAWAGGAISAVFQITSWTSLFIELNKKRGASKLVRVVSSVIKAN